MNLTGTTIATMTARKEKPPIRLAIRGRILTSTSTGELMHLPDGVVLSDAAGRISFVGTFRRARARYRGPVLDVRPRLIIPGFVDVHTHFPQARIIGRASGPLLDWLQGSVFPEEARFKRAAYARTVADEMIDRMLAAGTTTAAIFSSSSARATQVLFERLAARGLRAVAGLTLMNQHCPQSLRVARAEAIKACEKLIAKWHGHDDGRLSFAMTPRFALSCSRRLLEDAGCLAREAGLVVQTHIAENVVEGEVTLAAHSYAKNYLDVYDRAGLLGERTVLAHAIHLSRSEWGRLAQAGAKIAHCPDSNFFLGSGRMHPKRASQRGVKVALGSDVAAGRSFSMRRAMASAYDNALCVREPLELAALFHMATLGGAEVLGCEGKTGSLEEGKDADMVVLDLGGSAKTLPALLAELLFDNDRPAVSQCYVRGQRLALRVE